MPMMRRSRRSRPRRLPTMDELADRDIEGARYSLLASRDARARVAVALYVLGRASTGRLRAALGAAGAEMSVKRVRRIVRSLAAYYDMVRVRRQPHNAFTFALTGDAWDMVHGAAVEAAVHYMLRQLRASVMDGDEELAAKARVAASAALYLLTGLCLKPPRWLVDDVAAATRRILAAGRRPPRGKVLPALREEGGVDPDEAWTRFAECSQIIEKFAGRKKATLP